MTEKDCPCTDTSEQTNEISSSSNDTTKSKISQSSQQTVECEECNPVFWAQDALPLSGFHCKWPLEYFRKANKSYTVNMKDVHNYAKPFTHSEISEGIPKKYKVSKMSYSDSDQEKKLNKEPLESIDIYYFDHGNSAYYRTTDCHPIITMEKCAERTTDVATRFWAEIFGTIHIGVAFVVAFVLQLFRFLLYSLVRPLTIGLLQLFADYFIKPFLSILFNALIQPLLILFYNILTSMRDLCEPIAQGLGFFIAELAKMLRACRLIEVNKSPV